MKIQAEIRELKIRIAQLDKCAADRRAILERKYVGREGLYGITGAFLNQGDKEKITNDLANIEAQAEALRIKLADLQGKFAAMQPNNPESKALRKELENIPGEAAKQFEKLKKSLYAADEAAREFEKLKKREAALNFQLEGIQDYWRSGKQGQAASYILEALGRIFRDLKLSGTFKDKKGLFAK